MNDGRVGWITGRKNLKRRDESYVGGEELPVGQVGAGAHPRSRTVGVVRRPGGRLLVIEVAFGEKLVGIGEV